MYVREILYHVIQASTSPLYTALGTQYENHDATYTPHTYYGDDII